MYINDKIINLNLLLRGNETDEELYQISLKEFGDELIKTRVINISSSNLTKFPKCIQFFVNLEELSCYNNNLDFIDVSKNVNLTYLYCENNNLTSIDVSNNVNLQHLSCYNNPNLPYADIYYTFERVAEFRSKMNDYIRLQKLNKILN